MLITILPYLCIGISSAILVEKLTELIRLIIKEKDYENLFCIAYTLEKIDPNNKISTTCLKRLALGKYTVSVNSQLEAAITFINNHPEDPDVTRSLCELTTYVSSCYPRRSENDNVTKMVQQKAMEAIAENVGEQTCIKIIQNIRPKKLLYWDHYAKHQAFIVPYSSMWQCAQSLKYPDFYQAWHN
jgi:hypothetical protein